MRHWRKSTTPLSIITVRYHAIPRDASSVLEKLAGFRDRFDLGVAERVSAEPEVRTSFQATIRLVLLVHRQRPEEHALDQREHHRRAGDAERERQDRGPGKGLGPPQAAAGEPEILVQTVKNHCSRVYALSTAFGSSRDARQAGSKHATAATMIIVATTAATVGTSVGPTPNNSAAISRFRPKAPASPTTTPIPARRSPSFMTSASTLDRSAPSAIRIAISCRRSATMEDDNPIRAHDGEQQCQPGKEPKELRQEARSLDGFSKDRLHIAKANDRHGAVHFMHHPLNGLRQGRWCEGRAQYHVVDWRNPQPGSGPRDLLNCHVKLGSCFPINAALLDILRNAHDGKPRRLIVAARLDALPDRVSPFPEGLCELLVHDGDKTRGRGVRCAESCARARSGCPSSRNSRASRTDSSQRHGMAPLTERWSSRRVYCS